MQLNVVMKMVYNNYPSFNLLVNAGASRAIGRETPGSCELNLHFVDLSYF